MVDLNSLWHNTTLPPCALSVAVCCRHTEWAKCFLPFAGDLQVASQAYREEKAWPDKRVHCSAQRPAAGAPQTHGEFLKIWYGGDLGPRSAACTIKRLLGAITSLRTKCVSKSVNEEEEGVCVCGRRRPGVCLRLKKITDEDFFFKIIYIFIKTFNLPKLFNWHGSS